MTMQVTGPSQATPTFTPDLPLLDKVKKLYPDAKAFGSQQELVQYLQNNSASLRQGDVSVPPDTAHKALPPPLQALTDALKDEGSALSGELSDQLARVDSGGNPAQFVRTFERGMDYLENAWKGIVGAGAGSLAGQMFRDVVLALFKTHPVWRTLGITLPSVVGFAVEQGVKQQLDAKSVGGFDPHMTSRTAGSILNNMLRQKIDAMFPSMPGLGLAALRSIGVALVGGGRGAVDQLTDYEREIAQGGAPVSQKAMTPGEVMVIFGLCAALRACGEVPKQILKSFSAEARKVGTQAYEQAVAKGMSQEAATAIKKSAEAKALQGAVPLTESSSLGQQFANVLQSGLNNVSVWPRAAGAGVQVTGSVMATKVVEDKNQRPDDNGAVRHRSTTPDHVRQLSPFE